MPRVISTRDADFETAFSEILTQKREDSPEVDDIVAGIIADVRARGDDAVIEYTEKFDRVSLWITKLRLQ